MKQTEENDLMDSVGRFVLVDLTSRLVTFYYWLGILYGGMYVAIAYCDKDYWLKIIGVMMVTCAIVITQYLIRVEARKELVKYLGDD